MKINGSLVFDASSASEVQNLRVQKYATNPSHLGAADQGRLIFNTTNGTLYVGSPTTWVPLATGGNAAALQTEVDAIETALGAGIDGSGAFVPSAFEGQGPLTGVTSFTNAITQLAAYANANNTLAELDDVALTGAVTGDLLRYNGTAWADASLAEAGIQAADATLDALAALSGTGIIVETGVDTFAHRSLVAPAAGLTITNPDGVSGAPTFALANDLAALEGLSTTGLIARTADGAASTVTITGPAAGITVTNGDGVAGNPTLALANDLAALEGLTTTGYIVRTGDGTATTRSLSVVSGDLVITGAADGVATDTTFGLASVTDSGTGTFLKVTVDGKGRVTGTQAVGTADITALVDATYVNVSGDTMTGNLNMGGAFTVTGLAAPTGAGDAATKAYVDNAVVGLTWEAPVNSIVTSLPATATTGDRVYNSTDNKIYTATATNTWDAGETLVEGAAFFDKSDETGYVGDGTGAVQFTGGGQLTAGVGLKKTGNVLDINLGAGIAELPSDEVGLDIETGKAVQLTSSATGGQLTFVLDGGAASGLEQSGAGLKISAGGVTNAMLVNSQFTINGDTGTDSLILGDTLQVKGTSTQGISTVVTESPVGTSTFTITAADASASQKGVATFAAADFDVTAGNVTIKDGGVDNAQLANSIITITDGVSSDDVALGETLTFNGDGQSINAYVGANTVSISVEQATLDTDPTPKRGVAMFSSTDFMVTAGMVSLSAKSLGTLSDVDDAVTATAGHVLAGNGTEWTNKKIYHVEDVTLAAATWNVTHNLGVKYCNVTVVDGSDEVVIPQSITFDSTTGLTVTFNTAIAGKVVVMGIA